MNSVCTVDTSYRERRRIVRLLDFLTREQLTHGQMERIGRRLQKSGRRALQPLVRRLWKEDNHERLYRYTCMLDFFDADSWLDQVIRLTMKRRDLADEGRGPLLEVLHAHGVDISSPLLSRSVHLGEGSIDDFLEHCFQQGFRGLAELMHHFLDLDDQLRSQVVRRLGMQTVHAPQAAACLRMLACFEYCEVAGQAIESLGTLRHGCAVAVLRSLTHLPVEGLEERITRSLRRLGFLGIHTPEPLPVSLTEPVAMLSAQVSPPDCYGVKTLLFSWEQADSSFAALVLQIGGADGVRHAWCMQLENRLEHDEQLEIIASDEGLVAVPVAYGINLLRDALSRSIEQNYYLPPDLYASRYLFAVTDLRPVEYVPGFPVAVLDSLLDRMASLLSRCEELLDEPFFEGWYFSDLLVYDLAEQAGDLPFGCCIPELQQQLVERFCAELIEPDKANLLRYLLLAADFLHQAGSNLRLVQRVLALGLSLASSPLPLDRHPFIRRLAVDSIEAARQALQEGYDPRTRAMFDDGEEWE